MENNLNQIKTKIYDKCSLEISDFKMEKESEEYGACRFILNGRSIISRNAKITPKKVGQFVTFWKRNENDPIQPFNEKDALCFFVVNVRSENKFGQFVFPKSILVKKGILASERQDGKRAFRVYPAWDKANNKQAVKTQKWQLNYFYTIEKTTNLTKVVELYNEK